VTVPAGIGASAKRPIPSMALCPKRVLTSSISASL
jgi:hypothetical protein